MSMRWILVSLFGLGLASGCQAGWLKPSQPGFVIQTYTSYEPISGNNSGTITTNGNSYQFAGDNTGVVFIGGPGTQFRGKNDGTICIDGDGAFVMGSFATLAMVTNRGKGALILGNLSAGQRALITDVGNGSILIGAGTVSNSQAIVVGDGNESHGNKSVTAGSFWATGSGFFGSAAGLMDYPETDTLAAVVARGSDAGGAVPFNFKGLKMTGCYGPDTTNRAVSFGNGSEASGRYSAAFGTETVASGDYGAFAAGYHSFVLGDKGGFAAGDFAQSKGTNGCIALGSYVLSSGKNGAIALGYESHTSGDYGAFSAGRHAYASHDGTFVIADGTGAGAGSTQANEFRASYANGYFFQGGALHGAGDGLSGIPAAGVTGLTNLVRAVGLPELTDDWRWAVVNGTQLVFVAGSVTNVLDWDITQP